MHTQAIEFFSVLNKNCPGKRKKKIHFCVSKVILCAQKISICIQKTFLGQGLFDCTIRFAVEKKTEAISNNLCGNYMIMIFLIKSFSFMSKQEKKTEKKTSMIPFLQNR